MGAPEEDEGAKSPTPQEVLVVTPPLLREAVGAQGLSAATVADLHNRRLGALKGIEACPKLRR